MVTHQKFILSSPVPKPLDPKGQAPTLSIPISSKGTGADTGILWAKFSFQLITLIAYPLLQIRIHGLSLSTTYESGLDEIKDLGIEMYWKYCNWQAQV